MHLISIANPIITDTDIMHGCAIIVEVLFSLSRTKEYYVFLNITFSGKYEGLIDPGL